MNHELEVPANMEAGNVQILTKPSPREVSECAYYYYLNAGSSHGNDLEHWFRAEQDLMLGHPRTRFHGVHN
jgi:Protein of unknown function (DUF2934)